METGSGGAGWMAECNGMALLGLAFVPLLSENRSAVSAKGFGC